MDILKTLEELKISISDFIEKCHIPEHEATRIIYSNDDDSKLDLYWQFVTTLNDETLRPELIDFLSPYVEDKGQLDYTVEKSLNNSNNPNARRMLNSIKRLVSIAEDMEKIRPGKDVLKIFFFVVCIESLYSLASINLSKVEIVKDFFNVYINDKDKEEILGKVKRSLADSKLSISARREGNWTSTTQIDMNVFAALINELRNNFAHEGDYYSFHFASSDHTVLNSLNVPETKDEWKMKNNGEKEKLYRVYDIDLNYYVFKSVCVRGFVEFTKRYLESNND